MSSNCAFVYVALTSSSLIWSRLLLILVYAILSSIVAMTAAERIPKHKPNPRGYLGACDER